MSRRVVRRVAAAALVVAGVLAAAMSAPAVATDFRPGPVGSDDFQGSQDYAGDFPDPSVLRAGSTYYAYSTTIANKNLPVITSSDLVHWKALPSRSTTASDNDALWRTPLWSNYQVIGTRRVSPTWAPTVAHIGQRYVHAYATQLADTSRFCVSLGWGKHPFGPFVDSSKHPLVCPRYEGAIDPYLWVSPKKERFLLYKTEGISGKVPARLWIRRLTTYATGFVHGSRPVELLHTAPGSWEGSVIENPAMIYQKGHYLLFYSGNNWATSRYAVGYAICKTPLGPCARPSVHPLMATNSQVSGPGGESLFSDVKGRLRVGYHAWTPGQVGYPKTNACLRTPEGCPQRRLHVGRLAVHTNGRVEVLQYNVS